MRLAIALLVCAVIAAPAFAQQQPKNTTAPKPAGQQQKAQEKSQENNAPNPEQQKLSEQESPAPAASAEGEVQQGLGRDGRERERSPLDRKPLQE